MRKTIMIIAGEASGDLHGSNLIAALKNLESDIRFIGMGGNKMIQSGLESYQDIRGLSVIGLMEILSNIAKFRAAFRLLAKKLDSEKPDCVILIDYPEFNLRFAKEAKKKFVPVVYYISPQLWAWRRGRIKIVRKFVDKMLVIFGFEKEFYAKNGVAVEWIGHPLLDAVKTNFTKEVFLARNLLSFNKKTVAILPGSRLTEVARNLPVMLGAAILIKEKFGGNIQFLIAKTKEIRSEDYTEILGNFPISATLIEGYHYDCINASDLVLVASGTATLETAILEKPMLVIYRVSFLTWITAKILIKIPNIGLVNIVYGSRIVPEFIQFDASPKKIANSAIEILSSAKKQEMIKNKLKEVKKKLELPRDTSGKDSSFSAGPSQRAAGIILELLK